MNLDESAEAVSATRRWCMTQEGLEQLGRILRSVEGDFADAPSWQAVGYGGGITGPLYWVAAEMQALIEHAARDLPDEPLLPEELPALRGCCLLSRRPNLTQSVPELAAFDGMVGWTWWSSQAEAPLRIVATDLEGRPIQCPHLTTCTLWAPPTGFPIVPMACDQLDFGERPIENLAPERRAPDDLLRRTMLRTFWKIAQQRIATTKPEAPSRPARRRMEKLGQPVESVTVVRLRRVVGDHASPGGTVDWSHRWIVSGFWRRQFLPSVRSHRWQWIAPYVKGPAEKPLVLKERRHALVR